MGLIFKIAWRNLFRHKSKSIIIGFIIFLGTFIMTLGNAVLSGMDKGLQENIVNRFTGDIVLVSTNQKEDNVIMTMMGKTVEVISGYTNIKKVLDSQKYIDSYLPAGKGITSILNEKGEMNFTYLLGVNLDDYQKMFHSNVITLEGRLLTNMERGILVTSNSREETYKTQGFWVTPENYPFMESNLSAEARTNRSELDIRSNLVLMGFSSDGSSMDIRSSIKGIVKYRYLNNLWSHFNIMDIESFRECMGYVTAGDSEVKISKEKEKILNMGDEDLENMFGGNIVQNSQTGGADYDAKALAKRNVQSVKTNINLETGNYNLIFVKLKKSSLAKKDIKLLNTALSNANVDAKAIPWRKAAGQIGDFAMIIRISLSVFVLLIFFVAIIIILNTLVMAVIERTSELGMMRAIGSTREFIRGMIITETGLLSTVFGGAGIVIGTALSGWLAALKINAGTNDVLQLFFGGDLFNPMITGGDLIVGIIELLVVTILAIIYPLLVADRITPLEAIARE